MDMKRMCHSNQVHLPDLAGSEAGLDVDALHVKVCLFIPVRATMSACLPACVRFMQTPLLTMNCRRRTAEAGETAESSTRRMGISVTRGVVVVVSKRITGT